MIIFVVGTARSGTNWLGRILGSHPEITAAIEEEPQFSLITRAALYPSRREALLAELIPFFRERERLCGIFCEKSHPALWLVEALAEALPHARFLAIERRPSAVIRSMLAHPGVRARCATEWTSYPEPCPFLGLESREAYAQLSLEARCLARWQAHHEETARLRPLLGDRMRSVAYEDLVAHSEHSLWRLQRWLRLPRPFPRGVR